MIIKLLENQILNMILKCEVYTITFTGYYTDLLTNVIFLTEVRTVLFHKK